MMCSVISVRQNVAANKRRNNPIGGSREAAIPGQTTEDETDGKSERHTEANEAKRRAAS